MFPPIRTGTSFYSLKLAETLCTQGHDVTVVTTENKEANDPNYDFEFQRISALHIPLKNYFNHWRLCSIFPSNYIILSRLIKRRRIQIIILINHYLDIVFPVLAAAFLNKIPVVISVGTQLQSLNPFKNKLLNVLDRLICGRFVFPFCDKVVAWDTEISRYLQNIHGNSVIEKTAIINYGVYGDTASMMSHVHNYSLKGQILGVGAVSEQRSFVPLVEAFALVAKDFPEVILKIIGHIYYDAAVKRAEELGIADRVIFTGELDHRSVISELKRSDLYFASLTGIYTGLGTATIESMLLGIPTIANVPADLLGKAVLDDMINIVLCETTSPRTIADRIRTIMTSEELRVNIGRNGRTFIVENLNWKKVAKDMDELLNSVISEHKSTEYQRPSLS